MSKQESSKLRDIEQLFRAHDILDEILNNPEVRSKFNWDGAGKIEASLILIKRTLCWVLQHDEGRLLENNLQAVEKALAEAGIILQRIQ